MKSESEVVQSCPILSDPMDFSLPGSSIHGIFQARVLEWGAIAFSAQQLEPDNKHEFEGFPGGWDGKESACNVGDLGLIPGIGKIPWKRELLPTLILFGQRSLEGYSPWAHKE